MEQTIRFLDQALLFYLLSVARPYIRGCSPSPLVIAYLLVGKFFLFGTSGGWFLEPHPRGVSIGLG